MVEEKERDVVEEISRDKKKHIKNKWLPYTFGPEALKLVPYEVNPVTDIPIRLAVERGVIPRKRDLALFRTTEDWNGHPRNSIVIAGPIEEGQPFAVWIGDDSYVPPEPGTEVAVPRKIIEKPEIQPIALSSIKPREIEFDTEIPAMVRLSRPVRRLFESIPAARPVQSLLTPRLTVLFKSQPTDRQIKSPRKKTRKSFLALR